LIANFRAGVYTHVLFGPEQASSKQFRQTLRNPELVAQIGLVAIDECHLVKQWKDFRPAFASIGELRMSMREDVVWFGCSATVDDETEEFILRNAGFRQLGSNPYQTEVIRTSINRADIFLCVQPVPRGKRASYEALYFLLDESVEPDTHTATPQQIQKTIVFIDGRKKVAEVATYLQNALCALSSVLRQTNNTQLTARALIAYLMWFPHLPRMYHSMIVIYGMLSS
jgi:superfamily II DNA helicase RecQ